ncbi:hypothetical protein FF011L_50260 [Roseimaritima multifibrata]|uniref:Uncharacterized protein n=1 Tax=Roseimaritima multifibrata TaxID=1930274 RepID=A0A517MMV8_9BACT|nr:hypothetical protein FF011L_50260 [Roseimaritima multifibrata]
MPGKLAWGRLRLATGRSTTYKSHAPAKERSLEATFAVPKATIFLRFRLNQQAGLPDDRRRLETDKDIIKNITLPRNILTCVGEAIASAFPFP